MTIKTVLHSADIEYLLTQQEHLDMALRDKHGIKKRHWLEYMTKEHTIALNVEKHEFINEAFQTWKYWKKKPMNMENVIAESVDVIHFCMMHLNKPSINTKHTAKEVSKWLITAEPLKDRNDVKTALYNLSVQQYHPKKVLEIILQVLDFYEFKSQDIIIAYNKKNKENFERMENNY